MHLKGRVDVVTRASEVQQNGSKVSGPCNWVTAVGEMCQLVCISPLSVTARP